MQTKIIDSMNMKRENQTQVMPLNNPKSITLHDPSSSNESSNRFCMLTLDCSSDTNRTVAGIFIVMLFCCFICYYQCYECRQIDEDIRDLTSSHISRHSQKRHFERHEDNLL